MRRARIRRGGKGVHGASQCPLYQSNSERQTYDKRSCASTVHPESQKAHAVGQDLFQTSYYNALSNARLLGESLRARRRRARVVKSLVTRNRIEILPLSSPGAQVRLPSHSPPSLIHIHARHAGVFRVSGLARESPSTRFNNTRRRP